MILSELSSLRQLQTEDRKAQDTVNKQFLAKINEQKAVIQTLTTQLDEQKGINTALKDKMDDTNTAIQMIMSKIEENTLILAHNQLVTNQVEYTEVFGNSAPVPEVRGNV